MKEGSAETSGSAGTSCWCLATRPGHSLRIAATTGAADRRVEGAARLHIAVASSAGYMGVRLEGRERLGQDDHVTVLPSAAASSIDGYLEAVDRSVPGLVSGLYVTGSIALGDYQPAISDIDAVAVCSARPDADQREALARVHADGPKVDVLYATTDDLAADHRSLSLPCSILGEFKPTNAFAANPVEWRTLATKAVAVRGRPLDPTTIWFDGDAFRRWNLTNLEDYWVGKTAEGERIRPEFWARWENGMQWVVLGIPRLHYTIVTSDVISKSAAGAYALSITDERWHEVVRAAIALRANRYVELSKEPEALVADAVALSRWLMEDAQRLGDDAPISSTESHRRSV